jgi:hypothetical protein
MGRIAYTKRSVLLLLLYCTKKNQSLLDSFMDCDHAYQYCMAASHADHGDFALAFPRALPGV